MRKTINQLHNNKYSTDSTLCQVYNRQLKELLRQQTQDLVEIYPGFRVTREECQRRFGGVDLDYYRTRMKPHIFRSFVNSMGTIRGVEGLSDRSLEEYEG